MIRRFRTIISANGGQNQNRIFDVSLIVQSTLCNSCFHLRSQPKGQNKKNTTLPFFILPNIWASYNEISLNLIYSFDVWVAPSWDNQNTQQKRSFNIKWQNYKPLNCIGYCEKSGFSQRWRPSDIRYVKCGLV